MTTTATTALLYSAFRFRIHTASGTKTETQGETYAHFLARSAANASGGPVAVERWDPARQEWTLVDLAQPS